MLAHAAVRHVRTGRRQTIVFTLRLRLEVVGVRLATAVDESLARAFSRVVEPSWEIRSAHSRLPRQPAVGRDRPQPH